VRKAGIGLGRRVLAIANRLQGCSGDEFTACDRDTISGMCRPYLVSACLLGFPCAYDGQGRAVGDLLALAAHGQVVPICPEVAGGLPTPRPTAEIAGGDGGDVLYGRARVVTVAGNDVTGAFLRGAERALAVVQQHGISTAILRQRSPSCGSACIYDGTHSGVLKEGQGVTTALLRRHGVEVLSEGDIADVLRRDDEAKAGE
jgi:uncharacterized protein YbbK (DUF523 family)